MWNENSDEAVRPWAVAKKRSPVCSDMKWIWSEAPDYKSVLQTQDWWNWTNVKRFQSTPTHTNFTLKHETSSINCHTLVLHDDKKKTLPLFICYSFEHVKSSQRLIACNVWEMRTLSCKQPLFQQLLHNVNTFPGTTFHRTEWKARSVSSE